MGVPDGAVTTIETDGGGVAVVDTFWSLPETYEAWRSPAAWSPAITDLSLRILCADGLVTVGGPGTVRAWDAGGHKTPNTQVRPWIHGAPRGALWEEIQHFIACCHGEAAPLVSPEDALVAVRVAEAASLSASRGRPVVLAEEPALA
jgi:predicted dehydrogenase